MKGKRLVSTLMVAMIIVGMTMMMVNFASAQIWGEIKLVPHTASAYATVTDGNITYFTTENLSCNVAHDFNITMKITNVTNWCGFGAYIWFNNSLLSATGVKLLVSGAGNLAPIDPITYEWVPINNTLGRILFGFTITPPGKTGDYDIIELQFHILAAPPRETVMAPENKSVSCLLYLNGTSVVNKDAVEQVSHYENKSAFYEYIRPQIVAGAPTAHFTWSPTFPYVCDTVTVDGSTSETGDSTITNWDWSYTGPATWTTANGSPTRQFHCDGAGDVIVTLNVTNTLGLWDTEIHTITQKLKLGPAIDLYTQTWRQYPEGTVTPFDGKGAFEDADSFAPGENVSLWANVTYNGEIVQNILVGFEVLDPLNRCVTYRVDPTDEIGIAQVWFRIPIYCNQTEEEAGLFGHWTVIAKCKLQDDIINDTMHFKVGFIITIIDLTPFDTTLYKNQMMYFDVTLKNIAWVSRNVTVIVVVYDECDVPIGQDIFEFNMTAAPAVLCSSVDITKTLSIYVPKWAYVGVGHVYATAFTDLPQNCGVPYCPEVEKVIEIKP